MQPGMIVGAFRVGPQRVIIGVIVYACVVIMPMIMVVMMVAVHVQSDCMQRRGQQRGRRSMRMGGGSHNHPVACESKHHDEADDAPDEGHASTMEAKDFPPINGKLPSLKADYVLLNANPSKPRRSPV